MKITQAVVNNIKREIGSINVESGGIIGSSGGIINTFVFDRKGDKGEYIPNTFYLNTILEEWSDTGIAFEGIIHSHMRNRFLSFSDKEYADAICRVNNIDQLYMLIYVLEERQIFAYRYICGLSNTNSEASVYKESIIIEV